MAKNTNGGAPPSDQKNLQRKNLQAVGDYDSRKPPTNGNTVNPDPGTEAC